MTSDLPVTLAEASDFLAKGSCTSVELTKAFLGRIAATQDSLGAFVTVCEDAAIAAAERADKIRMSGVNVTALTGVPIAIKDIIATKDAPTTANSKVLRRDWGQGVDATVVTRLRATGAVIVGKTTTNEFALGAPDPATGFAVPHNPWRSDCTPGGSSSGTGIAVSAGLVLGGLGTDTGGSVRIPAAANGLTGLKVTFGRVPKNDVVPLAYSLDTVGPMARSALDCAVLLEVIAGYDRRDSSAAKIGVPAYLKALSGSVEGLRIGLPIPGFFDMSELDGEMLSAVRTAIGVLESAGGIVSDTVVNLARQAQDASALIIFSEAFTYHRDNLSKHWDDYGRFTRSLLVRGAFISSADYLQAQRLRSRFSRELAKLFSQFDVLITPGALGPAERLEEMDRDNRIIRPNLYTLWNLAGLPAAVVPCGFTRSGLPLAMQIIGRPFDEATVLRLADAYQRRSDWHLRIPPVSNFGG